MSDQQQAATITVSEAVRQALDSGCETNAAVKSFVQAKTGKIPAASTISVIRRVVGKPVSNGLGRPKKGVSTAVEYAKATSAVSTVAPAPKSPASKSVASRVVVQIPTSIPATELVEFAKAYRELKAKHGDKFNELVSLASKL